MEKLAQQLIFKHALTVTLPLVLAPNVKTRADWGLIPKGEVLSFSVAISLYVFHADIVGLAPPYSGIFY